MVAITSSTGTSSKRAVGERSAALAALQAANDPSKHEAQFYLTLTLLAGTRDTGQVNATARSP